MLINTRSINNKAYQLTELLLDQKIDVCCVTETWLREGCGPIIADIKREGYNVISCPRQNKKGGGTAFLCKLDKCKAKKIIRSDFKTFELLEVLLNGVSFNIRFSIIYRTGYLNVNDKLQFLKEMNDYVESMIAKDSINIILGDFNIRLDNNDNLSLEFIELFEIKGYKQIINSCTHKNGGTLDLIFIPTDLSVINLDILDFKKISDHYPIEFSIPLSLASLPSHSQIKYRKLANINPDIFKSNIKPLMNNISTSIIENTNDLNNILDKLNTNLLTEINEQAPIITKTIRLTKHVVSNPQIQEARRVKRRAEHKYKKIKTDQVKTQLKIARKNLAKVVEQSRTQLFKDKFINSKNDVKQTYKIINQLLNKNNDKIFPAHSTEIELANRFSAFYNEKIMNIRNSFNFISNNRFIDNDNITPLCQFRKVSAQEVLDIINNLENKQSLLDPIPCELFKTCKIELAPAIQKIINESFEHGYFPDNLKIAILIPIIKSLNLDPDLLNSFRPVSMLPIISKILEKCALLQLIEHLEHNNLNCKYQSAYKSNHSCETALTKIYEDVLNYITPTNYVVLVLLDFSAAFDTIDHSILIQKLDNEYGIKGKCLHWFSTYLSNRFYRVKINNTLSKPTELNFGVPQGSILGPVLFSLYINYISKIAAAHNVNIHFYADDIQLYITCDKDTDFTNLIKCLEAINLYTNNNFLKLNKSKTQVISLSSKSYKSYKISQLQVMGETIKVQSSVKNLGFIFRVATDFQSFPSRIFREFKDL